MEFFVVLCVVRAVHKFDSRRDIETTQMEISGK
jgi:hypothetical protein